MSGIFHFKKISGKDCSSRGFHRRSASLATASGQNLGAVSGLALGQGLELQDPTVDMQSSDGLGAPGFHYQSPLVPFGESHFSWLEPMEGRWSGADA
ncbi:unnamed protein product [Arabis nemorensis]|uniref:Uncharacterized protein n=1 Tax=Arabis nemorensis TaxID=586526 RepID=A0A565BF30_9BRAS|nr:unnamed protein product [Arabis nemorensis]